MKRILEMFGEPITYGGQESVVYNMLSTFKLGKDFIIDLYTPYYADNKELISLVSKNKGQVFSDNIDFKLNDNRLKLSKNANYFYKINNDYDIVHIHTGSLTTMFVYAKYAKKYNIKKVIVHSHTAGIKLDLFTKVRRFIINLFLRKYVDVYIGCSKDAITAKWGKYYSSKPIVVRNGIEIEKYKFNKNYREQIRNKYNIGNKILIGSLGRLSFEKNNAFAIEVLNKLIKKKDNIYLMIVGGGNYELFLRKKCEDLNVNKYVIFTGRQKDTYKFYDAFDIFVMPSFYEGMPVTAIEAQTSSLPCLISDSVTNECSISERTLFLSISDSNLWVDRIIDIINNSDYIINRDKVVIDFDKYDRTKTFKIVENIYLDKC